MNIRGKLTLQFLIIVSLIFILASLTIYGFSAGYRKENFYDRLTSKANNVAKLLIDIDEVDITLLRKIEKDNPTSLPNEKITVYDDSNVALFSTDEDSTLKTDSKFLNHIHLTNEIRYRQGEYEVVGFLFKGKNDQFVVIAGAVDIYGIRKLKNLRDI